LVSLVQALICGMDEGALDRCRHGGAAGRRGCDDRGRHMRRGSLAIMKKKSSAVKVSDIASLAEFHIPAVASLQERRPRTLKHGDTFAVFDHNGDVFSAAGNAEGLFHRDTRHLSHLRLSICDMRPMLLSSTLRDDNAALICDLTNPDLFRGDHLILEHDRLHLRRSKFLWESASFERIAIKNYGDSRQFVKLQLDFAADFADLFEVRGTHRSRRGLFHPVAKEPDGLVFSYTGLDGRLRTTRLRFAPRPQRLDSDKVVFEFDLERQGRAAIFMEVRCDLRAPESAPGRFFFVSLRNSRQALRASSSRAVAISTSNKIFNEVTRRTIADLYMLTTELPQGPYPYAGIPWFSTMFGRDALITAMQTLWTDPAIARGVLAYLAAHQAKVVDEKADAEPGKILHEVRRGEMAELGEVPFRHYYGSVDSTPLFVMLAGAYLERSGDIEGLRNLWPNIEAALTWIDVYGDIDGDGFVEYGRKTEEGLINQGWKDSHDSVFHADGALARGPIALVEVQGYVYAAKCAASNVARRLGFAERADVLGGEAESLRSRFDEAFWDAELGTYVLALDADKRPCRVRTSNAGHALFTGIALQHRAASIVASLMSSSSFSGWGIRTIATSEVRYNPMSYHNGSVWPHDNSMIAIGFARYGFAEEAARLFKGLYDASHYFDLLRLPELFCGFARQRGQAPTLYPVACSPQAWATAAPLAFLQACLGLGFDLEKRRVVFNRPLLPVLLDEVTLSGLTIGPASIDVMLRRVGSEVELNVMSRQGDISAVIVDNKTLEREPAAVA
jgi:glycogen debranching enzyme